MEREPGLIVILNGAPRSGKSSIAAAIQASFPEPWLNIGVDGHMRATPRAYQPGIGLRPGGERPDLEPFVAAGYSALYASIAAHSRAGLNVVADVGHHDAYSRPLAILPACARLLAGLPTLFVGVRCPLDVVLARRGGTEGYLAAKPGEPIPDPVQRWQDEVHRHGLYDLEVDTSLLTPDQCAARIRERLVTGPAGEAMAALARRA